MILVSSVPTAVFGYLLCGFSQDNSESLLNLGIGFLISGIILIVADMPKTGKKIPKDIGKIDALVLGAAQGISVLPGISRTGITISCGLLRGYSRKFSIKYSFLMSIPAVLGALLAEIGELRGASFHWSMVLAGIAGMLTAAVTGFLCIRKILNTLQKKNFRGFACYSFLIGILTLVGYFVL